MSTVIRKGIVELELRATKARLEAPQIDAAARAYKEVEKAQQETAKTADEVAKATERQGVAAKRATDAWAAGLKKVNDEWKRTGSGRDSWGEGLSRMRQQQQDTAAAHQQAARAAIEATRVNQEFGAKTLASFREAGEGALRLTRGLALLGASGSDDMRKIVQSVALAQGALDVFAGGLKVVTNLATAFGGPVAAAIAGATAAIGLGVVAWSRWKSSAEEARKAAEEAHKAAMQFAQEFSKTWDEQQRRESAARSRREAILGLRRDASLTPESRAGRLAAEGAGLAGELRELERERERRLGGFQPGGFRGGAEEAFAALLEFGSRADLGKARDFEERRQSISERQLKIDQEQFKIQKESIEASRRITDQLGGAAVGGAAGIGVSTFAPFATQAAANATFALNDQMAQAMRDFANRAEAAMNTIIDTIEAAAKRAEQIERQLTPAHPN